MEFRQLEYFCTISELENFTRTAQVLHVSQPSVTKAIKALEAELELTLIDRSQKHVTLTEEGRAFLIHAQKIMEELENTKQDMIRFRRRTRGTIHFGLPPMVEAYLFPNLFVSFRAVFPDINLDLQEYADSQEVIERIELGELDFGVIIAKPGTKKGNSILMLKDKMNICMQKGHRLAKTPEISFYHLNDEKFILQHPRTYQYREVFARARNAGFTPEVVLSTSQLKTIKQLVAKGLGISLLPNFVTKNDRSFIIRNIIPEMPLEILMIWSSRKIFSQIDTQFVDFMRSHSEAQN